MMSRQVLQKQEPGCPEHPVPEPTDEILVCLAGWDAPRRRVDVTSAVGDVAPYLSVFAGIA